MATTDAKFDVDQWLKGINIWDEKYDYLMHDDHWLSSEWSAKCEKCLKHNKNPSPTPPSLAKPPATQVLTTFTSSPPNQSIPPPKHQIPVTPIAPQHISTRAFVTPHSSMKFNDTYTRSARLTAKKLSEQMTNQDLINLNETFDLYKSALAETPESDEQNGEKSNNDTILKNKSRLLLDLGSTTKANGTFNKTLSMANASQLISPLTTPSTHLQPPKPRTTNFELLTNNSIQSNDRSHNQNKNHDIQPGTIPNLPPHEPAQPVVSRISRIPLKFSRN